MKIKNMKLENFQGIKLFEMNPDGKSVDIYGENGTGKTTIANAYYWLLFGKPSTDEKNYTPETVESTEKEHSVTVLFSGGEKNHELKKVLKKHGKSSRTECYIDDLGVKQKEFDEYLSKICPISAMKQLAREDAFLSETSKEERRKVIIEIARNVNDSDIINSDEKLKNLPKILNGKTIEIYKKIAKDKIKELKKESDRLSILIDAGNQELKEPEKSKEFVEGVLQKLKETKKELEEKKNATPDEKISEIRKEIATLEAKKIQAESMYQNSLLDTQKETLKKLGELEREKSNCKREMCNMQADRHKLAVDMDNAKKKRESLIKSWEEVSARQFGENDTCPFCGQKMPENKIADARKAFNVKKSNELEEITKAGKEVSKEVIESMEKTIKRMDFEAKEMETKISEFEKEISGLKNEPKPFPFKASDICKDFDAKISNLKKELELEKTPIDTSVVEELAAIENDINKNMRLLIEIENYDKKKDELEEMEKNHIQCVAECENYEFGLHLCKLFSMKKSEIMEEKVNSVFENVHFRLFRELVNGEIEEDCEPLVKCREGLIPYSKANHAAKVRAGLEVIQGLSDFYEINMPVFIDNAESITGNFPKTAFQQIRLHAKENEKELRCEYDG